MEKTQMCFYTLECGHTFGKKECIELAHSDNDCCFICDLQFTNRESYYLLCGEFNETIDEFYTRQEQIIEQLKKLKINKKIKKK